METVQHDDVRDVQAFVVQVRTLCGQLLANPFDTEAAEALLDVLLDRAPAADEALGRVLQAVVDGSVAGGAAVLGALAGRGGDIPDRGVLLVRAPAA
jgi:hypothetical protein